VLHVQQGAVDARDVPGAERVVQHAHVELLQGLHGSGHEGRFVVFASTPLRLPCRIRLEAKGNAVCGLWESQSPRAKPAWHAAARNWVISIAVLLLDLCRGLRLLLHFDELTYKWQLSVSAVTFYYFSWLSKIFVDKDPKEELAIRTHHHESVACFKICILFSLNKLLFFNTLNTMADITYETCPTSAPFFGFMGVTAALCFASEKSCCFSSFVFSWLTMICSDRYRCCVRNR